MNNESICFNSRRVVDGRSSIIRNTLFVIEVIYSIHSLSEVKVLKNDLFIYF